MAEERFVHDAAGSARRLAPAEAGAIVAVRGLLDEAIGRARDSTVVGRQVAAVLMDGAAEAAMAIALARFNDAPTERDKLDELHRRLTEHLRKAERLGANEGLDGWADVRRLRRVRNNAQHHQIPADHQTLVSWSGGVRRFVAHVVAAAYEVELTTVSAAVGIEHDELRGLFAEAEVAQALGDTRTVVGLLERLFGQARRLWNSQRHAATGASRSPSLSDERGLLESIIDATRHLEETLTVAPFALDLGEYVWWQKLLLDTRNDHIVITAADATRAMTFVFTWIVRWESFSARYLGRERLPFDPPDNPPPSRRLDGAPELDTDREPTVQVQMVRRWHSDPPVEAWVFRVPYRIGRPENENRRHAHHLDEELWSNDPSSPWKNHVTRRGSDIEVSIDPNDFDPDAILDQLENRFERAAIQQAEEAVRVQAARTEQQQLEDAVAAVAPQVLAICHDGEQCFDKVTLELRAPQPSVLLHFTKDFANLLRAEVLGDVVSPNNLPVLPPPARMRYDGIECPLGRLHDLTALVVESLDVIDNERRRIRDKQAETLGLAETLDAVAKESIRHRDARRTTEP